MADDPDNRFAPLAAPHYSSSFTLEPGQKIITIGSCFARNIEQELAARGFDIPMQSFVVDKREWARDPGEILNNYVPGAVAPQIRWAFGLETYDLATHAIEVAPGRYIDPYLAPASRPIPAQEILARRASLDALYRQLATSHAVIITLGYVEAWFDHASGYYVNSPPPLAVLKSAPERFELHVLDYDRVRASLVELFDLLDDVCPPDYRVILTVSPAPLHLTFTDDDIAVANTYSKSLLRAAAGEICARRGNIDYFPSYESVVLSPRDVAYGADQIHVTPAIVRFNIDRMLQRYLAVDDGGGAKAADILKSVREMRAQGHHASAFFALKSAWSKNRDNPQLTVALAQLYHSSGLTPLAERMLSAPAVADRNDLHAMLLLARIHISKRRFAEAALLAEKIAATGKLMLPAALVRAEACYNLGRYEEGLAAVSRLAGVDEANALKVALWRARLLEKLGRFEEAETLHRQCNTEVEAFDYLIAYAQFLAARDRLDEARVWLAKAIAKQPYDVAALRLRARIGLGGEKDIAGAGRSQMGLALARMRRLAGLGKR
ncbi:MAG TPA: GSCFA domain-containing protein [Rhodoblastus sp.]|nr:GSCFA domain-containing protein [Rhodoblastus sp.]